MTRVEGRPELPKLPEATNLGATGKSDARLAAIRNSVLGTARVTATAERTAELNTTYQSRVTNIGSFLAAILFAFDYLFSAGVERRASAKADRVVNTLQTAAKAQQVAGAHLQTYTGIGRAAAGTATGDLHADSAAVIGAGAAGVSAVAAASDLKTVHVPELAKALAAAGAGDTAFYLGVFDAMTPRGTEQAGETTFHPAVLNDLKVSVAHESVVEHLNDAFTGFAEAGVVPTQEEAEQAAVAYAKALGADEGVAGIVPPRTDAQVKALLNEKVAEFITNFRTNAAQGSAGATGAGSQVATAVAKANETRAAALASEPHVTTIVTGISEGKKHVDGLMAKYETAMKDLQSVLDRRDDRIREIVAETGMTPTAALATVRGSLGNDLDKAREKEITRLVSDLEMLHAGIDSAQSKLNVDGPVLIAELTQKATEAKEQHDKIVAAAQGVVADGAVTVADEAGAEVVLSTAQEVMANWGYKPNPAHISEGNTFSIANTVAAMKAEIKASPDYRASIVEGAHKRMYAQAAMARCAIALGREEAGAGSTRLSRTAAALVDATSVASRRASVAERPFAGRFLKGLDNGAAAFETFAGAASAFKSIVKREIGAEDLGTFLQLVWENISEIRGGDRVLKAEYAALPCFRGYTGAQHAERLLTHDVANPVLVEAVKQFKQRMDATKSAEKRTGARPLPSELVANAHARVATVVRGKVGRRRAAANIQRIARGYTTRRGLEETRAATNIQRVARGRLGRLKAAEAAEQAAEAARVANLTLGQWMWERITGAKVTTPAAAA